MAFRVEVSDEARRVLEDLAGRDERKLKKVRKALKILAEIGPHHPGLNSHRYYNFPGFEGENVWQSYVENHTPGAWRIWWCYRPGEMITVIEIGAHL